MGLGHKDEMKPVEWKSFKAVAAMLNAVALNWTKNSNFKYIGIRIDTRTMDCIVTDRDDNYVSVETLHKVLTEMRDPKCKESLEAFYGKAKEF